MRENTYTDPVDGMFCAKPKAKPRWEPSYSWRCGTSLWRHLYKRLGSQGTHQLTSALSRPGVNTMYYSLFTRRHGSGPNAGRSTATSGLCFSWFSASVHIVLHMVSLESCWAQANLRQTILRNMSSVSLTCLFICIPDGCKARQFTTVLYYHFNNVC